MDNSVAQMGQVVFSDQGGAELRILGLGSCVGLCVFDPSIKLAAVVHIVLPESRPGSTNTDPGKYADTAVPYVIAKMVERGAQLHRLRAAIVGGAQLFSFAGAQDSMNVGERNVAAVKAHLTANKIRLIAEEVGGKVGRTVVLDSSTGDVIVRKPGAPELRLVSLSL